MGECYKVNASNINVFLDAISNVDIDHFDNNAITLSSSFFGNISSFLYYGSSNEEDWNDKLKKWEIDSFNINYYLKDKKNQGILLSLDEEKLYQAAEKAGFLMHAFCESKGFAKESSVSIAENILEIINLKKIEKRKFTDEVNELINGFESNEVLITNEDESEIEHEVSPSERDSSSLLIRENSNDYDYRKPNFFSLLSSSISSYLSGSRISTSDLNSQGGASVGLEGGNSEFEVNLIKRQLVQLIADRQQITHSTLKEEIIKLLNDPTLCTIQEFPASNGASLLCPKQFWHDSNRTPRIRYDGTTIFKTVNGESAVAKFVKKEMDPQLVKNNELIVAFFIKKLGQDLFNKVFSILHQSQSADLLDEFNKHIFEEVQKRDSYATYSSNAINQEYDVHYDHENNKVTLFVKILYKSYVAPENEGPSDLGFFGLRREITFDVDELLNSNDTFPSLVVKEMLTDLEPTKKFVAKKIKLPI